jgi:hypothetical protein
VQPGQSFEYCAVLESQTVSGTVQASAGKRQNVAITGDVPKVENFKVEFDENHETVNISYTRPKLALAKIKVFQIPGVPSSDLKAALADERVIPFERLKQGDIEGWLGKEIIESEVFEEETPNTLEMRRIPLRDPEKEGSVTYVAVSTLGADALISKIEVLHLVGSIGGLKLFDRFDYQILAIGRHFAGTLTRHLNKSAFAVERRNFELIIIRKSHAERVKPGAKVCRSCRHLDSDFSTHYRSVFAARPFAGSVLCS